MKKLALYISLIFTVSCATPPEFTLEEMKSLTDGSVKVLDTKVISGENMSKKTQDQTKDIHVKLREECSKYSRLEITYPISPSLYNKDALIHFVLDYKKTMRDNGFNFATIHIFKSFDSRYHSNNSTDRYTIRGTPYECSSDFLSSIDELFLTDIK